MSRDLVELWLDYNRARKELARVLKCKNSHNDFITEIGASVVAEAYGVPVSFSDSSGAIHLQDGRTVVSKATRRNQRGPIQLTEIKDWDFDILAIVVFDEDGYVESANEVLVAQAREIARFDKMCGCWRITLDEGLLRSGFVHDITEEIDGVFGGQLNRHAESNSDDAKVLGIEKDPLSIMRNKSFAMKCLQLLKDHSPTLEEDIKALLNGSYCKEEFGHSFAILKCVTGMSGTGISTVARDAHGNRRYYESPIPIGNESYIISNDWYGLGISTRDNRTPFLKWVRQRASD